MSKDIIGKREIEELGLSKLPYLRLKNAGYKYIVDIPKTEVGLRYISKIGPIGAKEIVEKLIKWYEENDIEYIEYHNKETLISDVKFSFRTYNILMRNGYTKISDIPIEKSEIFKIKNIRRESVDEIIIKLKEYNII